MIVLLLLLLLLPVRPGVRGADFVCFYGWEEGRQFPQQLST
jgi:hypothetical protein